MLSMIRRLVHVSQGIAIRGRSLGLSYIPSTRRNGEARRQEVYGCIFITVMVAAAFGAGPFSDFERQALYDVPTIAASFTGWKKPINESDFFSVHGALGFDHYAEASQRRIGQAPSNLMIPEHVPYPEVFHADRVEPPDQFSSGLLQMVHSTIGYVGLDFGNPEALAIPPATTFYSSGENPLGTSEGSTLLGKESRVGNPLTIGEGCQSIYAKIYSDYLSGFRQTLHCFIQAQRHEIAPRTVLGYRDCGGGATERSGPMNMEPAKFCYDEISIIAIPLEGAPGVFGGLFSMLLFETGIGSTFIEEISEGSLKVPESLLGWNAGDIIQPSMILTLLEQGEGSRRIEVTDSHSTLISIGTQAQSPIVDIATGTEGLSENRALRNRGIESEPVANLHSEKLIHVKQEINLNQKELHFLNRLKAT